MEIIKVILKSFLSAVSLFIIAKIIGHRQMSQLDIFDYITSITIGSIGAELAEKYGIPWLYSDFKKREGYKRSIVLSKEYDLYRQNYCGCVFSKRDSVTAEN